MCGINFIFDKKGILDEKPIANMQQATRHRGPDYSGIHIWNSQGRNFFFSASRLAIMDKSAGGNQPFVSDNGNHVLLFNGEIYNFHELKNPLLAKGYRFRSSSDSEVLLYAMMEQGEAILDKLQGMFALVYFDKIKEKLIAARDKSGMKPLYYFHNDLYLILSSEIKGILASGLVEKKLNESQIPHYLQFRFAKKPETFYQNIYELEEGKAMEMEGDDLKIFGYEPSQVGQKIEWGEKALTEKVQELVYDAFLKHAFADAPMGLFLSGGVDSTLLLALAKQEIMHLPTFSIVFDKSTGSYSTVDAHYSRLAVRRFGNSINHHEIPISMEALEEVDEMVAHLDQPIGDNAALLTWYLSRFAAGMVKSVMSGAGADELFAGYNRHLAYYQYLTHFQKHKGWLFFLKKVANWLPDGLDHPYRKKFRLIKKFMGDVGEDAFGTFLNFTSTNFRFGQTGISQIQPNIKGPEEYFWNALEHDKRNYLISDVLMMSDGMSMAHGLEMRMPYLDAQLVGFVKQMEAEQLIKNGKKWILKEVLRQMGGEEFCKRPKEGFGLPFGYWLGAKGFPMRHIFSEKPQIIHKFVGDRVEKMHASHLNRKADYSAELWSYMILVKWLRINGFADY